jgi:hypothetical protein
MKAKLFRAIILSAALAFSLPAFAAPRLVPDSRIPDEASKAAVMDSGIFARVALVASGANEADMPALLARLDSLSSDLAKRLPSDSDEAAKAEAVLSFLYERTLSRYSEFQTRVDVALNTGEYNCVSSAILFSFLAKSAGLKVEGVETPLHAFCTVETGGKKIDVETTNPYGFDPGARKELPSEIAAQKRYVLVPRNKYANRKPIDDRRLIALVYNNRISLLERKGGFEDAVSLAVDAWKLQDGQVPQKDLADRFSNYAVSLSRANRDPEGLDFIGTVTGLWGDYPGYREYAASAVGKMLNGLTQKNDYAGAFALLSARAYLLDPATYADMNRDTTFNYLRFSIDSLSLADALAKIDSSRNSLGAGDREKLLTYSYSREAERIASSGKWLDASAVLDAALRELPGQADLVRQRTVYRQNYAIEIHNKAVAAYNSGDIETVKALLDEGLAVMPDSALLKNDLAMTRQN